MAQIVVTKVRVQGKILSDGVGGELAPLSISCVPASVLGAYMRFLAYGNPPKTAALPYPNLRDTQGEHCHVPQSDIRSTIHHICDGGLLRL